MQKYKNLQHLLSIVWLGTTPANQRGKLFSIHLAFSDKKYLLMFVLQNFKFQICYSYYR